MPQAQPFFTDPAFAQGAANLAQILNPPQPSPLEQAQREALLSEARERDNNLAVQNSLAGSFTRMFNSDGTINQDAAANFSANSLGLGLDPVDAINALVPFMANDIAQGGNAMGGEDLARALVLAQGNASELDGDFAFTTARADNLLQDTRAHDLSQIFTEGQVADNSAILGGEIHRRNATHEGQIADNSAILDGEIHRQNTAHDAPLSPDFYAQTLNGNGEAVLTPATELGGALSAPGAVAQMNADSGAMNAGSAQMNAQTNASRLGLDTTRGHFEMDQAVIDEMGSAFNDLTGVEVDQHGVAFAGGPQIEPGLRGRVMERALSLYAESPLDGVYPAMRRALDEMASHERQRVGGFLGMGSRQQDVYTSLADGIANNAAQPAQPPAPPVEDRVVGVTTRPGPNGSTYYWSGDGWISEAQLNAMMNGGGGSF